MLNIVLATFLVMVISVTIGFFRGLIRIVTKRDLNGSEKERTLYCTMMAIMVSSAIGMTYVTISAVKPENLAYGSLDLIVILGLSLYTWRLLNSDYRLSTFGRRFGLILIYWLGIGLGSFLAGYAQAHLQIELMICVGCLMFQYALQVTENYQPVSTDSKK